MKKFLIILIIIFICGILSADVCLKQMKESSVIVGMEVYEQYAHAKLTFKDVFWNMLYERIKLFGVLFLLCFTPMKEKMGVLLTTLFSFVWGFFLMSCIIELGVGGLVVGLASVLPHGVLYAAVIAIMIGRRRRRAYHVKRRFAIDIGIYIFLILLFTTACILESLIGTHFIPWVIRLSLI